MTTSTAWNDLLAGADDRFAAAARASGLLDAQSAVIDTPVGPLLVLVADGAIVRVAFDVEDHDLVLAELAGTLGARIVAAESALTGAVRTQLAEYFAGDRATFDLPLDLRLARGPFRREVLEHLLDIPIGDTRTYAELATIAGRPRAIRAVGSGCATNPLPVLVPCHRVLRTGGELGGYLGGVARKRWLLEHERRIAS